MSKHRSNKKATLRSRYAVTLANTDAIFSAITPELDAAAVGSRSSVNIEKEKQTIAVQIESGDIASLRAATNSWLRLLIVAIETDAVLTEELNPKPHKCD